MSRATDRIPSLDGLRAVSILLVIFGHLYMGTTGVAPTTPVWLVLGNASLGVTVFFVISGYLITTLLLRENDRTGAISLWNFYVRRVFRILPPFYFYLAILTALGILGVIELTRGDLISAFTFTWDYSPVAKSWTLQHVWSLSVEEQFYIFWPSLLVFILTRRDRSAAAKVAALLIVLAPFLRVATYALGNAFLSQRIYFMLHTRVDSLMFGCLVALTEGSALASRVYNRLRRWIPSFAVFTFAISPQLEHRFGGAYTYTVGYSIIGAAIALSMLRVVREPESVIGRLLNTPVLVRIGVLSYGIYIWQFFFLSAENPTPLGVFPVNMLCIAVVAELSYRFVELPTMAYRKRFERRASESKPVVAPAS